ncbi:MAG TPA: cytochrome c maturation protein CcmE [Bryobacteraceae bacterium]|nr:cytochrome c maturation protein CcmE [Bryobacteraceae bacterium]
MKPYLKFGILVVAIVGTLGWLAAGGISETKTYYKEIKEVNAMGKDALDRRIRVGGDVQKDSIVRSGKEVRFILTQNELRLPVVYVGNDPLPDTFRDGSQALADGRLGSDGVFQANRIQAKCASKYEGKPGYKVPPPVQNAPVQNKAAL